MATEVLAFQTVCERPIQNGRMVYMQIFSGISACFFQNWQDRFTGPLEDCSLQDSTDI